MLGQCLHARGNVQLVGHDESLPRKLLGIQFRKTAISARVASVQVARSGAFFQGLDLAARGLVAGQHYDRAGRTSIERIRHHVIR